MIHMFDAEVAKKYGVDEAILLYDIAYWVFTNKASNRNYYEGKYWTYNSGKAYEKLFPYWNDRQIRNKLQNMVKEGLILKGTFNENPYDHTSWYTLTDKGESISQNLTFDWEKNSNSLVENYQSYNTTKDTIVSSTDIQTTNKIPYIYNAEIEEILNFLNEKTGKHYTTRSKASVKMITERLKEGYTVDEFKSVIQNKTDAWLNNPEMKVYLRPETLFCAKHFESYLNDSHTDTPQIDLSKHYYQPPEFVPQTEEEKRRSQEWWDSLEEDEDV